MMRLPLVTLNPLLKVLFLSVLKLTPDFHLLLLKIKRSFLFVHVPRCENRDLAFPVTPFPRSETGASTIAI